MMAVDVDELTRAKLLGAQGSGPEEILDFEQGRVPPRIAEMLAKTARLNRIFAPVLSVFVAACYLAFIAPLAFFGLFGGLRPGYLALAAVLALLCGATLVWLNRRMRQYEFDTNAPFSQVEGALTNASGGRPGAAWSVTIGGESFYVNAYAAVMLDEKYAYRAWFHPRSRYVVIEPLLRGG